MEVSEELTDIRWLKISVLENFGAEETIMHELFLGVLEVKTRNFPARKNNK